MTRKKTRNKRQPKTPEQISFTCENAAEAYSKGIDVHRAYIQNKYKNMSDIEKYVTGELFVLINEFKEDKVKQNEILTKVRSSKTADDLLKIIHEYKGEKTNEENNDRG